MKRKKRWFQGHSSRTSRGNLTREVPMPPLGDPGTYTTHERATSRGEPRAWYESKVDTLPR